MALNSTTLAALIAAKVNAVEESYKNGTKDPEDALQAIAEAIIEHITADAEVKVAGGGSYSGGVFKVE